MLINKKNSCLILAGGRGTRIEKVLKNTPKALAPISSGVTFLELQIRMLIESGINHFVISLGHLSEKFVPVISKLKNQKINISTVTELSPLGTGGAILENTKLFDSPFCVVNGDTYFAEKITDFVNLEVQEKFIANIALVKVNDALRYGSVKIDSAGTVTAFQEKNRITDGYISAGLYKIKPTINNFFLENFNPRSVENDVFPELVSKGVLKGIKMDNKIIDIGIPEDYMRIVGILKENKNE